MNSWSTHVESWLTRTGDRPPDRVSPPRPPILGGVCLVSVCIAMTPPGIGGRGGRTLTRSGGQTFNTTRERAVPGELGGAEVGEMAGEELPPGAVFNRDASQGEGVAEVWQKQGDRGKCGEREGYKAAPGPGKAREAGLGRVFQRAESTGHRGTVLG